MTSVAVPSEPVVIARKQLKYFGADRVAAGEARIYAPNWDGRGWWHCDYEVVWPNFEQKRRAEGSDSYAALSLAMQMIPVEIAASDDFKSGRIGLPGEGLADGEMLSTADDLKRVFDLPRLKGIEQ